MSNNLGNLLVGFGLDLSALQKDAPEAFRILNQSTSGMSAEMKRASREGAESLRLIDEALGIHVSRPLTRILTQEFPGLATALQSVLGGAVFGAVATVGVEAFDKVLKTIEKAQKAEEEFADSGRKVSSTFEQAMGAYEKSDKLRSLSGIDKKIFEVDSSSLAEATKRVDSLTEAMLKNSKAAQEASSPWTEFLAAIGNFGHQTFSLSSTLGVEAIDQQMQSLRERLQEIAVTSQADPLKGMHQSLAVLQDEAGKAKQKLDDMKAQQVAGGAAALAVPDPESYYEAGPSSKEMDAQQRHIDNVNKLIELMKAASGDNTGAENEARKADAAERQLKAQESISALYKEMGGSLAKLQPETDPIQKLNTEIAEMRSKAVSDLAALVKPVQDGIISAFSFEHATASEAEYEKKLDQLKLKLDADILAKQAFDLLQKPLPGGVPKISAVPTLETGPAPTPTLGAGGLPAQQFSTFSGDQAAQLKAAAAAYADLVTPEQKYQLAQQELNLLLEKGLIDQTAYTAALQKAQEEMSKSTDKLEKLLEKTTDASAGMQAFFLKLNSSAGQDGKFTFDILNQGLQGFENNTISALTGGKTQWRSYFDELTKMALKFELNKLISSGLTGAKGFLGDGSGGGSQQSGAQASSIVPPGLPDFMNLPKSAFGTLSTSLTGGAGGAAQLGAAATTLQTGSTELMTAAAELQAAASTLSVSGGAGGSGIIGDIAGSGVAFAASGTDDAPGGLSWVGENGPELLNLPGGSSVTPSSAMKSGGDQHFYIDAKGAEIGVEEKIVRAIEASRPRMVGEAIANFSEIQRRSVQPRR